MSNELEKKRKRKNILDAARDLFTEFGYRSVTVSQIAEKASVAKGTVYLYFKDKESLFYALIDEFLTEIKEFMSDVEKWDLPLADKLHSVIYNIFKFRHEQKFLYRVSMEAIKFPSAFSKRVTEILDDEICNYLEGELQLAIDRKEIRPCNPKILSFVILNIYSALAFKWEEKYSPLDEKQVTQTVTDILKYGLVKGAT